MKIDKYSNYLDWLRGYRGILNNFELLSKIKENSNFINLINNMSLIDNVEVLNLIHIYPEIIFKLNENKYDNLYRDDEIKVALPYYRDINRGGLYTIFNYLKINNSDLEIDIPDYDKILINNIKSSYNSIEELNTVLLDYNKDRKFNGVVGKSIGNFKKLNDYNIWDVYYDPEQIKVNILTHIQYIIKYGYLI